jgi:hypothetical protein
MCNQNTQLLTISTEVSSKYHKDLDKCLYIVAFQDYLAFTYHKVVGLLFITFVP